MPPCRRPEPPRPGRPGARLPGPAGCVKFIAYLRQIPLTRRWNTETEGISPLALQAVIVALVAAAFANIYLTQPVLPVLARRFSVSPSLASLTVSAVLAGMVLANLPFGMAADRLPIRSIITVGAAMIVASGLVCTFSTGFWPLVASRFVQGLSIPALTTCLAAHLGRSLPRKLLNVAMGAYVSATVLGGLSGRLLGGWLHSWRAAFFLAALLVALAAALALWRLPARRDEHQTEAPAPRFAAFLTQPAVLRTYSVAFAGMTVFTALFNYMAFRLAGPPFFAPTGLITAMYLSYLIGIVIAPLAGGLSSRLGSARIIVAGTALFAAALLLTLLPSLLVTALALCLVCLGFFAMHAAASGSLNRLISAGQGRANALYVLAYYLGAFTGVTLGGFSFEYAHWPGLVTMGLCFLLIPAAAYVWEILRHQEAPA